MIRRRLPIVSAMLLLIGVGVYWATQPPLKPGVTLENFKRLHKGMSVAEARAILGSNGTERVYFSWCNITDVINWDGEAGTISISYWGSADSKSSIYSGAFRDESGKVIKYLDK